MDNPDTRVDITQNDVRTARTVPQDLAARGERPAARDADAPGASWPPLWPTARRTLVGNPRRVRL